MSSIQTILLTGSDGFIGLHVAPALQAAGYTVMHSMLRAERFSEEQCMTELQGVDAVVNLVGLAHSNPRRVQEHDYRQVNAEFPTHLGCCALASGVQRFVHVSSVKAVHYQPALAPNDEANNVPAQDIYGASKYAGEQNLLQLDWRASQCVVLRPSLVYGTGVKANMRSLLRASRSRLCPELLDTGPRSMLNVNNFCSALMTVLAAEQIKEQLYIITDSNSLTVADIQKATRRAMMRESATWQLSAATISALLGALKVLPDAWLSPVSKPFSKLTESELYTARRFEQEFNWVARHGIDDAMPDMLEAL